jgi:hypothetical protein
VPCRSVDGCIAEYADFLRTRPDPLVHTLYVLGCVTKISDLERGKYRGLVDLATALDLAELAQMLRENRQTQDGHSDDWDHAGHDLTAHTTG